MYKYEITLWGKPYRVSLPMRKLAEINALFEDRKTLSAAEHALYLMMKVWAAIRPRFLFKPFVFRFLFLQLCDLNDIQRASYVLQCYENNIDPAKIDELMAADQERIYDLLKKKQDIAKMQAEGLMKLVDEGVSSFRESVEKLPSSLQ